MFGFRKKKETVIILGDCPQYIKRAHIIYDLTFPSPLPNDFEIYNYHVGDMFVEFYLPEGNKRFVNVSSIVSFTITIEEVKELYNVKN